MVLEQNQVLISLAASTLIGGIIGLEREKIKQTNKTNTLVGIRTDILISLFGALSMLLSQNFGLIIFYLCLGAIFIFTLIPYIKHCFFGQNTINVKNEVSTIIVFLLGGLAMSGQVQIAIEIAILTVAALSLKKLLHKAVYNIQYDEIIDALKFALIAFIILPFLPNQSYDQAVFSYFMPGSASTFNLDILNPYRIWLIIVIISGIKFLGYILVKILGKSRGIGLMGMLGGLYSSTITSLTLAEKSKKNLEITWPFIAGITLACATSFLKMFILIKTLNSELFGRTVSSMLLMAIYLLFVGLLLLMKGKKKSELALKKNGHTKLEQSPFKLSEAIKLGSIIIGTLIVAQLILSFSNINFYYIASALMAFLAVDDPILISTSELAGNIISFTEAKNIIVGVIFLNLIQKIATVYFFGNRKLVKPLSLVFAGLFLVTVICFLYL